MADVAVIVITKCVNYMFVLMCQNKDITGTGGWLKAV